MKNLILLIFIVNPYISCFSQGDTIKTYIFIGHPRSDEEQGERVLKTVEIIDYSKYDLLLLGGDLTWNTSKENSTLEYCDEIFNLGDENTHWALGNHDVSNVNSILEFTKKPRYYAFGKNNITFLVLDTELDSPDIKGDQLKLIRDIADTIENSDYLILIHHKILWMIDNDDLKYLLDSVALSTSNISHSNFYDEVYPNLQKARNKGIEVLCLAGDRTDINIEYSPEDSIYFLASGLKESFSDDNNFVILLTHNLKSGKLSWEFVPLSEIDTIGTDSQTVIQNINSSFQQLSIYPNPTCNIFQISMNSKEAMNIKIEVLNCAGTILMKRAIRNEFDSLEIDLSDFPKGVYFFKISNKLETITKKIVKL
jgi:Icc-related predicted phosphoesterase